MFMSTLKQVIENKQQFYRTNSKETNTNNSIELPEEVLNLITDNNWKLARTNRYKKLIRDGEITSDELVEFVEMAAEKDKPDFWFAKIMSKNRWERTKDFLVKLREIKRLAKEVADRIPVPKDAMRVVYKACWRFRSSVIVKAVTAQETGRDQYKYFCWLIGKTDVKFFRPSTQ